MQRLRDWTIYYTAEDEQYPLGSAKEASSDTAFDGTPFLKNFIDHFLGVHQAIWKKAGKSADAVNRLPDNATKSDVLDALISIIKTESATLDNVLKTMVNEEIANRTSADDELKLCMPPVCSVQLIASNDYDRVHWTAMANQTLQNAKENFPEFYEKCPAKWKVGNDVTIPKIDGMALFATSVSSALVGQTFDESLPNVVGISSIRSFGGGSGNSGALEFGYVATLADKYPDVAKLFPDKKAAWEDGGNENDAAGGVLRFDASKYDATFGKSLANWIYGKVVPKNILLGAIIRIR